MKLETSRLVILLPGEEAAGRAARYCLENVEHHAPTSPPRPDGFLTEDYWRERLLRNRSDFDAGRSLRLFIFNRGQVNGPIVGSCSFTEFIRGPFQACFLGYGLHHAFVGQGLMYEALGASIQYVFDEMGIHRIMANYMPTNERSGRLLRRLGFVVEGYGRDYLYIDGAWRDHVLTALVNPNAPPPTAPGPRPDPTV